ncbi:hypothetical protein [Roseomonas populi]|uniref:Uncharacterized protein n=1 Tax=Roseomonas populi TaxID=3121582 RepID=A0ABT1X6J4_9PROT|nr:hypothetical protein [Roseomonas pecuniae]MCR0983727.1 hypothetical protein [Roseomonas pecuniae]
MSEAASAARAVLWPAAGLAVWGAHFGAIYAVHAHACERGLQAGQLLGLPWVAALVAAATLLALAALALLFLLAQPVRAATEGGEPEPGFTRWFGAAACVLAGFAVLFQAAPAAVLPACW